MKLARALLSILLVLAVSGSATALEPRVPLAKNPVLPPVLRADSPNSAPLGGLELVVKFADRARVRATADGGLDSLVGADLASVRDLAGEIGLTFAPLFRLDTAVLADIEERAARRSGREQPDLAGMVRVVPTGTQGPAGLEAAGEALQRLEIVEFVSIHVQLPPPPTDLPPETPDMVPLQGYRGPDPGIDAEFAGNYPGGTGEGIRLSDCEYGWDPEHEDLNDIDLHLEPGQTVHPEVFQYEFDHHGSAVIGSTSAQDDGYGCTGLVPDAHVQTFPEYSVEDGVRRVEAIASAVAASNPGDVVMLEMQDLGAGGDYAPAEVWEPVWVVTRAGVDAGVVIVAAAGNGDQDLDAPVYASYMNQGDSGAIIVGAGTADLSHDKMYFSTYGARVDVHGWGEAVRTLGYGDGGMVGGPADKHQYYTAEFAGTSSATPIVAGACVAIQGIALAQTGATLTPGELRELLAVTGTPQGTGGSIGPLPDLAAAIAYQFECVPVDEVCDDGLDNDCDGLFDEDDPDCAGDDDDDTGDDDTGDDDTGDDDTGDDDSIGDDDAVFLIGGEGCSCSPPRARPSGALTLAPLLAVLAYRIRRRS
jgi:MYXO-CTERM domain-containing protein